MIKKKIALISVWNHNYGSLLQTYALQRVLLINGIDNEIISYKEKAYYKILRSFNILYLVNRFKFLYRNYYLKIFHKKIYSNLLVRDDKFRNFKTEYFNFSELFQGYKKLITANDNYSTFVLGSDQVLHPANLKMKYFTLEFVSNEKLKIAYAPSFGVSRIPLAQKSKTINYLKQFDYLSVREKSGQKIISTLINKDVPLVCDPTLLLNKEEWMTLKGNSAKVGEKYIFCYFLGGNNSHREFANKLKQKTGYKIVSLPFSDEFVKGDIHFADSNPFDIGPKEFVNLISNAEYVVTDSFHGTIFSLIFERLFFSFSRFSEKTSGSTNSRIDSILTMLDLMERKLTGEEDISKMISMTINYSHVNEKLNEFRDFSKQYLIRSILCQK